MTDKEKGEDLESIQECRSNKNHFIGKNDSNNKQTRRSQACLRQSRACPWLTKMRMKQDNFFENKSLRLKDYDYSYPGAYFITICTFKRKCLFGELAKEKMKLNTLGKIADACLADIPTHFKNTEIGEYVIMPNHVHAVVYIYDEVSSNENKSVGRRHACDSQGHALDLQRDRKNQKLFDITGSYKSAVSKIFTNFILHFDGKHLTTTTLSETRNHLSASANTSGKIRQTGNMIWKTKDI